MVLYSEVAEVNSFYIGKCIVPGLFCYIDDLQEDCESDTIS